MNELTFTIALLYEKGILSSKEAKELHKLAVTSSLNNSLPQMISKIRITLDKVDRPAIASVKTVDAKDVLK